MELEDLIMLSAASLLATHPDCGTEKARQNAVKEARLLWEAVWQSLKERSDD